ncbi:PAS domain S-box protein [Hymenobacter crusticola]|uniref:histidine kinase n=1 Tax=Hymenobacter crusticola TaxID=1770526 RepID=A0A243WAI4_9BACT|nr:PAS domain S-box protein [Hymenobacter crusticola]OUJ72380.1 hypothetical protein BXP70_19215 [Hymenobacter crusticola]
MPVAASFQYPDVFPCESLLTTVLDVSSSGLVLCTPVYDSAGTLQDLAFAFLNPVAQQMLGLPAQPSTAYVQQFPNCRTDESWAALLDAFLSNERRSFQLTATLNDQLGRWQVESQRVGGGLLLSLTTEAAQPEAAALAAEPKRRQAEEALRQTQEQQAFLLHLSDRLRPLADPAGIQYEAACALGQYVGASRVGYAEDQGDNAHIVVTRNYTQAGVASLEGYYHYDDYGPELLRAFKQGRSVVRPDIAHDPELSEQEKAAHAVLQLGATINVPLLKDGQLIAVLFMHYPQAHAWRDEELALLEETAERTWSAVMRARSEAALRASEKRFRTMADAVPQIIWITDGEGRTEFFNRQWSRYTGVAFEPSTAAAVAGGFVHPADGARTMEVFEQARRTGTVFEVEHRIRAADGTYRWFLVRAEPFRDPASGQIIRWYGSSADIDDRKQAEETLRAREQQLTFLLQLSDTLRPLTDSVAVQVTAARLLGEHLAVDRAYYIDIDETAQQFVVAHDWHRPGAPSHARRYPLGDWAMPWLLDGQTWVCRDVDTDPVLPNEQRAAYRGNDIRAAVVVPLLKQGRLVATFVANQTTPRAWTAQEVALVEEVAERIWGPVERVRVQEALRASEEKLAVVFAALPVGVGVVDIRGNVVLANSSMQQYLSTGVIPARDARRGRWRAYHPDGHLLDRTEFPGARALRGEEVVPGVEMVYTKEDGTQVWTRVSAVPLLNGQSQVSGHVMVVIDITAAKEAEQALRQSQQQLQHSNAQLTHTNIDLDNFIYTASHDLKAPITNIEGLVSLVQEQLPPELPLTRELQPILDMMQDAVTRFKRTLDHLSDVVKLQKEHTAPVTAVLLQPVIEEVRQDLQPLLAATGAQVVVDVAACPGVWFSPKNLRSVVYNLLSNAVKFRHPDRVPQVRIFCQLDPAGQYLVLRVQDNGLGIAKSQYQELFTMFRRLHTHVEGSGLGLYMVKRIVENEGGRVEVQSQLQVGTTFSVYLPYRPFPTATTSAPA